MIGLTERQHALMLFIQRSSQATGISPTVQECASALRIAKGATHAHIAALIERGYLEKLPHKARTLQVIKPIPDDRFFEAVATAHFGLNISDKKLGQIAAKLQRALLGITDETLQ